MAKLRIVVEKKFVRPDPIKAEKLDLARIPDPIEFGVFFFNQYTGADIFTVQLFFFANG